MTKKKDTRGELSLPDSHAENEAETEQIEKEKAETETPIPEVGFFPVDPKDSEAPVSPRPRFPIPAPGPQMVHLVAGDPAVIAHFSRVMKDLKEIKATGHHDYHDYRYPTEFDLTEAIRPLLGKHGIGLATEIDKIESFTRTKLDTSSGQEFTVEWARVWILIHATIDLDRGPDAAAVQLYPPCVTFRAVGEGEGEKGLYKAQTGALNYWLRKTFLAGATAADDPERPAAATSTRAPASASGDGISDPQRRRIYGVGSNLTKERIHDIIEEHTGNKSASSISRGAQYEGIIEQIERENAGAQSGGNQQPRPSAPVRHEPAAPITDKDIPF